MLSEHVTSGAPRLRPGTTVVGKSTVLAGTAAGLLPLVEAAGAELLWYPEFLREGFAVKDTLHADRVVVRCGPCHA